MRNELKNILKEFENFKNYLENIDASFFDECSREELNTFLNTINKEEAYQINDTSLKAKVLDTINRKKVEEYPELLQVHHYPKLKEIDFLSEEDKIKLDTFLAQLGINFALRGDSAIWRDFIDELETKDISNKILQFLYDNKIVEKKIRAFKCCDMFTLSKKELNKLKEYVKCLDYSIKYDLEEEVQDYLYCGECGEEISFTEEEIDSLLNTPIEDCIFKIIAMRDTSLDNV